MLLLTALHVLLLYVDVERSGHYAAGEAARAHAVHEETARRWWPRQRRCRFEYLLDGIGRARFLGGRCRGLATVGRFAATAAADDYDVRTVSFVVLLLMNSFVVQVCGTKTTRVTITDRRINRARNSGVYIPRYTRAITTMTGKGVVCSRNSPNTRATGDSVFERIGERTILR